MLTKTAIDVSFAQGLDTKTDPKRVAIGNFVSLQNSVFSKGGLLQKRNGYVDLPALPSSSYTYLTTVNDNLTAIGSNIAALNAGSESWVQKGQIQPLSLNTLPLIRNNLNQTACDAAVAPNGLVCTVYTESNGSTVVNKYAVADSVTGQNIVAPSVIPVASGTVSGGMRVFVLGNYFVIVFTNTITATPHLQYVSISTTMPTVVSANTDIAASYVPATTLAWDGFVAENRLYVAYNTTSGGQSVAIRYLTSTFVLSPATVLATYKATIVSVTVDVTVAANPTVYLTFYRLDTTTGYIASFDQSLNAIMAPLSITTTAAILNLTSAAQNGTCSIFYEVVNNYAYDSGIPSHVIIRLNVTGASIVTSTSIRSVGLASKAFIVGGTVFYFSAYQSPYQPTYFLINGSLSTHAAPVLAAKVAYENGGGYLTTGLPGVTVTGEVAQVAYLYKDLIQAVNKDTNISSGTQVGGIYSQTGVNLVSFTFGTDLLDTAEIANDLHITGGYLTLYDGYLPVEHGFFVWPDSVEVTTATGGGGLTAQDYFYQATYEWTDNQGNAYRSAPSLPVKQTTTTATSTNTIHVPTLRLTEKVANPVKIVLYRWSTAQQNYYQVTSITTPVLNDPTTDSVTIVDALADATILGNNLIYTTGGVVENIAAPACKAVTIFDSRLWYIDAEDQNTLGFSKQVIEATPVETSDLFTIYVPPATGTIQNTGPMQTIFPMDDKIIIGKRNSFLYINGTGPDNTGANNQYSQPIFITSTVGCANQKSIVLVPQGLMFQSDKGIWLLDRGLNTSYIGAPVEDFTTGATVNSAVLVPETNQVRFTLDTGITLMYDYFYGQWGSFAGVPAISSCIYAEAHTYINSYGTARQETPGVYLDGSSPVLMQFTTGPLRLDALQSYQRAYFFYLLGDYISPHKLYVTVWYDYEGVPAHSTLLEPDNYSAPYGSGNAQTPYGQGNPYGGPGVAEEFRVFLNHQRCKAFSISVQEIFDSSLGVTAGGGLTLSGINVVLALKQKFAPAAAAKSFG